MTRNANLEALEGNVSAEYSRYNQWQVGGGLSGPIIEDELGARVQIQHTAKGKGKLVLNYNSLQELDGILEHIK